MRQFADVHGQATLDLTVVVAALDADRSLEACLASIWAACRGFRVEVFVVGPGPDPSKALKACPAAVFMAAPPKSLVPDLWAKGIARAQGRVVALTTGHTTVTPLWAKALVESFEGTAAGVGGPFELAAGSGLVDWGIFYLRYSPFLLSRCKDGVVAGEIAGDNAAYLLADLRRHESTMRQGFWEFEFHGLLRAEGRTLRAARSARAAFGPSYHLSTFLHHRFRHGQQFARARIEQRTRSRASVLVGAPLLPWVFAWRAANRLVASREHLSRFAVSLPLFLLMASAWAAGEAVGALAGDSTSVGPVVTSPRSAK